MQVKRADQGFVVEFTALEFTRFKARHEALAFNESRCQVIIGNGRGWALFDRAGLMLDGSWLRMTADTGFKRFGRHLFKWGRLQLTKGEVAQRALRRKVLGTFVREERGEGIVRKRTIEVTVLGDGSTETAVVEHMVPMPGTPDPTRRSRRTKLVAEGSASTGKTTLEAYLSTRSGWRPKGAAKGARA